MAGSFYDGCYNPKKRTPGQLLSYCKKISANTQHLLFDVLHLHFYSTKKAGFSNSKIAEQIGKTDRTIRREITRGTITLLNSNLTTKEEYCADVAHRKYLENASNKGPGLKIGNDHK